MSFTVMARVLTAVIIAAVFTVVFGLSVQGGNSSLPAIEWKTQVDISEGVFAGLNAEFYFVLPPEWYDAEGNLLVEVHRITYADDADILDWFNIYFLGSSELWQVMRLYVYDKVHWRDGFYPLSVVLKTQSYVFAVDWGESRRFMDPAERELFVQVLDSVSGVSQILRCITLADGHTQELEFSVIVDGEILPSPVEIVDGVFFIPLREACDVFGYNIWWTESEQMITITNNGILLDQFVMGNDTDTEFSPRFNIRTINDRVYVVTAYFVDVFRKNVQIDDTHNVIITSRIGS